VVVEVLVVILCILGMIVFGRLAAPDIEVENARPLALQVDAEFFL
jgi:hypothetical protein